MNKLMLTNNIIDINQPLLTVKELLNNINYEYNDMFLDKFWQNIKDDVWIYIDDNMLKYIGYSRTEYKKNKQDYLTILKENFEIENDYKLLFLKEFEEFSKCQKLALENIDINTHNKVKHLIVSPDCFKQSLMLLKTQKSKEIKKYYIELERVFKFYLEYQNKYRKLELENKNQELEEKENIINKLQSENILKSNVCYQNIKLNRDEYIYIASTNKYIHSNIYKVGKTTNFQTRIHTYQTGRFGDDKYHYLYIFKCHNSSILEQYILDKLKAYRYVDNDSKTYKELFQIDYNILLELVELVEEFENNNVYKLNKSFKNQFENKCNTKPEIISDLVEYLNNKENEYCDKYKTEQPNYLDKDEIKDNQNIYSNEPNRSKLTKEIIEQSLNNKIKLISDYNGNCEEELEFECTSIFKHRFKMSYSHMLRKKDRGCYYCTKHGILEKVKIYEYDTDYNYIKYYNEFNEIKKINSNYQLLKNIIREKRWLTPNNNKIYSILEPDANNKLNINKELNKYELKILEVLNLSIDEIILKYKSQELPNIYAIDEINKRIYKSNNYTTFTKQLYYLNSTTKKINRKTIPKHINTNKKYGGYIWTNNCNYFLNYQLINLD